MPPNELKLLMCTECHSHREWSFAFHRQIEWDALQLCWNRLRNEDLSCHFIPIRGATGISNDIRLLREDTCNYIDAELNHNILAATIRVASDWLDDVIQIFSEHAWYPEVEFYLPGKKSKLRGSTRRGLNLGINHDAPFMQNLPLDPYLLKFESVVRKQ